MRQATRLLPARSPTPTGKFSPPRSLARARTLRSGRARRDRSLRRPSLVRFVTINQAPPHNSMPHDRIHENRHPTIPSIGQSTRTKLILSKDLMPFSRYGWAVAGAGNHRTTPLAPSSSHRWRRAGASVSQRPDAQRAGRTAPHRTAPHRTAPHRTNATGRPRLRDD
jgi:hypothetical protein